jgi:hypothetical protein
MPLQFREAHSAQVEQRRITMKNGQSGIATKNQGQRRNVACLEGQWDNDLVRPLSVRHILQTAADTDRFSFIHMSCNTESELDYNLRLLKRRKGFQIIYLAFHGAPGRLVLPTVSLSLEELAEKMGNGFMGRILHLGACDTINVSPKRLASFMNTTGISLLMGYKGYADWVESASVEMLLLARLQRYKRLGNFKADFSANYKDLIYLTGLKLIQPH